MAVSGSTTDSHRAAPSPAQKPALWAGPPPLGGGDDHRRESTDPERILESIIECLPEGVIVADRSGKFLIFNTAARTILGIGPREVQPENWVRTYGFHLPDGITPYPPDELPLASALRGEVVEDAVIFVRNENVPEGRWINANALPWRDASGVTLGGLIIIRDISDKKRSRELNERLSNVVEQTADSVFITESDGTIVYVNPAFERTTGYGRAEVLGRTPRMLRSGEHEEGFYEELWQDLRAGGAFRGTLIHCRKNGELFHAEHTISPMLGADGSCEYVVSVAKDITERLQIERHKVELEAAQAVQKRLYPREAPQTPGFDIAGAAHPAESLCGDYYDFFPMPGGCLGMTIADVCGHGVGPSILMAQARAYLRSLALAHADVGQILDLLNSILTVEGSQREFITQIVARLDPDARTLVYANAGHPSGLLLDRHGALRQELGSCGLPLGVLVDRPYRASRAIRLEPGDVLVLFTDGMSECCAPDDSEFGARRILDLVRHHRGDSSHEIQEALYRAVIEFRSGSPQLDDITAIVCKVQP